jgi:hypothetical protein
MRVPYNVCYEMRSIDCAQVCAGVESLQLFLDNVRDYRGLCANNGHLKFKIAQSLLSRNLNVQKTVA